MYCEVFLILKKNVSQTGASPNQILTITLQQMISQWMSVRQEEGISSWSNLFLNDFHYIYPLVRITSTSLHVQESKEAAH